jgi:hypothetical protein|tara:strand:+ start:639 stop:1085 length:447 start_codon:yes stop_codon:yes gene_type:complete
MKGDYNIKGNIGDAFIRITREGTVELIFGEDDMSITREMEWEDHEIYKIATQFSLMIDSYVRNSAALDDLILNSTTGSIPKELIGKDLLPMKMYGVGYNETVNEDGDISDFDIVFTPEESLEDKIPVAPKQEKNNVIQFKKRKNDEDK